MKWFRYWLFLLVLGLYPPDASAHHAGLTGIQKELIAANAHLPHTSLNAIYKDYSLFVTILDRAPDTVDLMLYLEDNLKRPIFGKRAVVIEDADGKPVFSSFLEPDDTGIFYLRYSYDRPLKGRLKVSYEPVGGSGTPAQWLQTDIQLGSPAPSITFLIVIGLVLLATIVAVKMRRGEIT
ncbi:MAG: hypothetical protein WC980_09260 [Candidatus Brocadiia bacterium]